MPNGALSPSQKSVTWLVVADGKESRIYEYCLIEKTIPMGGTSKHLYAAEACEGKLVPLPDMAQKAEPLKDYEVQHDQLGSVSGSAASVRNSVGHADLRKEIKLRFMQSVAQSLEQAYKERRFDRLVIAAPPRMLCSLRDNLGDEVSKRIAAEIPKELAHFEPTALLAYAKPALVSTPIHA